MNRRHSAFRPEWGWQIAALLFALCLLLFFYGQFVFEVEGRRVWGICDDIYVSACYARNFAQGEGLVWFAGAEKVEGFSNPLWVALLTLWHLFPFAHPAHLGLFVIAMNVLALVGFFLLLRATLLKARKILAPSEEGRPVLWGALALLAISIPAFPYWLADGFEVGLVALLALAAFNLSLDPKKTDRGMILIGLLAGLAFWTRMDGILCFSAPWLMVALLPGKKRRPLLILSGVPLFFIITLFLMRHAYYGQWLPNTYYAKVYGWPLGERLAAGIKQNTPHLANLLLLWLPLVLPGVRRFLGWTLRPILPLLTAYTLCLFYSTSNGGDSWGLQAGFDRFTLPGGLLLLTGLMLAVLRLRLGRPWLLQALIWLWLPLLIPFLYDLSHNPFLERFILNIPRYEKSWIHYGLQYKEVSRPGARIALQPAGAIIYFSERGGVDLLGKCDPFLARQPVNKEGWTPGHNKQHPHKAFEKYAPHFSKIPPPPGYKEQYETRIYEDNTFYVRKGSDRARWEKLLPPEPFTFAAGWDRYHHLRTSGDVDGDGRADIIGFGEKGVWVSLSRGKGFAAPSRWTSDFSVEKGWNWRKNQLQTLDLNGDNRADLAGFGDRGLMVALSNGKSFGAAQVWIPDFGEADGWIMERHVRLVGDVNGDGLPDVVGCGEKGVLLALNQGEHFDVPRLVLDDFSPAQGWNSLLQHPRWLADMNGDGRQDLVGLGNACLAVALSQGESFKPASNWSEDFSLESGWFVCPPRLDLWAERDPPRYQMALADWNGDGLCDVGGFGAFGLFVGLSKGDGLEGARRWSPVLAWPEGLDNANFPYCVGDFNGDNLPDVLAFFPEEYSALKIAWNEKNRMSGLQKWARPADRAVRWRPYRHFFLCAPFSGNGKDQALLFSHARTPLFLSPERR